jgi:hypothetical protein
MFKIPLAHNTNDIPILYSLKKQVVDMVIWISTYEYVIEFGGDMENQAKLVIAKMLKRQLKLSLELERNLQSKYMLINLICLHFVNSQGIAFYHINIKLLNLSIGKLWLVNVVVVK